MRSLLYIAALHASQLSHAFQAFRHRLTEAGKSIKVVLIATKATQFHGWFQSRSHTANLPHFDTTVGAGCIRSPLVG